MRLITERLTDVIGEMISDIETVKNKYSKMAKRLTVYPEYIGWAARGRDVIMLETTDRLDKIPKDFVITIPPRGICRNFYCITDRTITFDTPLALTKYLKSDYVGYYKEGKPEYTVILDNENQVNTMFKVKGIHLIENRRFIHASNKISILSTKGTFEVMDVDLIPQRNSKDALGNQTAVMDISPVVDKSVIVFTVSEGEPNTVRVTVVKDTSIPTKLNTITGSNNYMYVFPFTKERLIFPIHPIVFNRLQPAPIDTDKIKKYEDLLNDKETTLIVNLKDMK